MQHQYFSEGFGSSVLHAWQPENTIQINQRNILLISEKISTDEHFKFRQAALRIFNFLLASMDNDCKVAISARHLSKKLGISYDTVTKSLKYLKAINVLKSQKQSSKAARCNREGN